MIRRASRQSLLWPRRRFGFETCSSFRRYQCFRPTGWLRRSLAIGSGRFRLADGKKISVVTPASKARAGGTYPNTRLGEMDPGSRLVRDDELCGSQSRLEPLPFFLLALDVGQRGGQSGLGIQRRGIEDKRIVRRFERGHTAPGVTGVAGRHIG